MLYNEEVFDPAKFDDSKVIRYSKIFHTQFDPHRPSYQTMYLRKTELEDDTDLV